MQHLKNLPNIYFNRLNPLKSDAFNLPSIFNILHNIFRLNCRSPLLPHNTPLPTPLNKQKHHYQAEKLQVELFALHQIPLTHQSSPTCWVGSLHCGGSIGLARVGLFCSLRPLWKKSYYRVIKSFNLIWKRELMCNSREERKIQIFQVCQSLFKRTNRYANEVRSS